jgi:hypothetical protein
MLPGMRRRTVESDLLDSPSTTLHRLLLDVLFLDLCELLLQMRVESLLRFGAPFRRLCNFGIHPRLARKAHTECEHVIVPVFAIGVLVHVADFKSGFPSRFADANCASCFRMELGST